MQYGNGHYPEIGDHIEHVPSRQRLHVTNILQGGVSCGGIRLLARECQLIRRAWSGDYSAGQEYYDGGISMATDMAIMEDIAILDCDIALEQDMIIADDIMMIDDSF